MKRHVLLIEIPFIKLSKASSRCQSSGFNLSFVFNYVYNFLFTESDSLVQKLQRKVSKKSFALQAFMIWLALGIPGILVTFYLKTSRLSKKSDTNITVLTNSNFELKENTSHLECHEIKSEWDPIVQWSMYFIQGEYRTRAKRQPS